ncbi:MAG: helix-turn-helix domain-containing protein [Desulfatibacillum sp.]|nr:helix-turn-helix domain-containing protein [Desulfatibacillum sp.]
MKIITIYIYENALSSTITGPMDLFSSAGIMWNYFMDQEIDPHFMVELASIDGRPVRCFNNLTIEAHKSIDEVEETDLILVPAVADDIDRALGDNRKAFPWLAAHGKKGTLLASVCTGAFLLAESGVLDGRKAATHWAYAGMFRERYPNVRLETRPLVTRDGNTICTAGSSSWGELSLYLVQAFCGKQVAVECSKSLLLDMSRTQQAPYGVLTLPNHHQDQEILKIQEWLQGHYREKISLDDLASRFSMSERTFKRRFKKATGGSPLGYLQKVRIEAAKGYLEQSNRTLEEVVFNSGYEDVSFFRKLFKRHTGLSPNEYRKHFSVWDRAGEA